MATLRVSRPVVRQALRLLENEQLLTVRRGALGGARVDSPSHEVLARYASLILMMDGTRIEDVFRARTVLELEAVRLLATTLDPEPVDRLRGLIGEEEKAVGDNEAFGTAYENERPRIRLRASGVLVPPEPAGRCQARAALSTRRVRGSPIRDRCRGGSSGV
jgi:DNA-binding GntR family transcriptional regulator